MRMIPSLRVLGMNKVAAIPLVLIVLILGACGSGGGPNQESRALAASEEPSLEAEASAAIIPEPADAAYKNPRLGIEARVADLLSRMTDLELLGQIAQVSREYLSEDSDISDYALGSVLAGGDSAPGRGDLASWRGAIEGYQRQALSTRLGIPLLIGVDAVHGFGLMENATVFPHNIGMGASGDPALARAEGKATAAELLAAGVNWDFAPCVAAARDERWGRTYESYGETSALPSIMGSAFIEGLQGGQGLRPGSVLATAKHFAADGGTKNGVDQGDAPLSEAELESIHLAQYRAAVRSGCQCVMISFSSVNGLKCHENKSLISLYLKGRLGFSGFVVSDWGGVRQLAHDTREALAKALDAGVDMVMIPDNYRLFQDDALALLASGRLSHDRLRDSVGRILRVKFAMGLFERPMPDAAPSEVGSSSHRELARRAARESFVLLRNEGGALPLGKGARILLLGEKANDIGAQCGGWTMGWQGMLGDTTEGTTLLSGLRKRFGEAKVAYAEGVDSIPAGFKPDAVVVVAGEAPYAEGRGDDSVLELNAEDSALFEAAKALNVPVIGVLITGRPLILGSVLPGCAAFMVAWLPGTEGEALADLLSGEYAPKGRLPCTWPESVAQLPINSGDGKKGLYPYGYGLTW
jgi:beta-glucosidase